MSVWHLRPADEDEAEAQLAEAVAASLALLRVGGWLFQLAVRATTETLRLMTSSGATRT